MQEMIKITSKHHPNIELKAIPGPTEQEHDDRANDTAALHNTKNTR